METQGEFARAPIVAYLDDDIHGPGGMQLGNVVDPPGFFFWGGEDWLVYIRGVQGESSIIHKHSNIMLQVETRAMKKVRVEPEEQAEEQRKAASRAEARDALKLWLERYDRREEAKAAAQTAPQIEEQPRERT